MHRLLFNGNFISLYFLFCLLFVFSRRTNIASVGWKTRCANVNNEIELARLTFDRHQQRHRREPTEWLLMIDVAFFCMYSILWLLLFMAEYYRLIIAWCQISVRPSLSFLACLVISIYSDDGTNSSTTQPFSFLNLNSLTFFVPSRSGQWSNAL